jgi:ribose transport system permease protein/rhamnose transport system permease protein
MGEIDISMGASMGLLASLMGVLVSPSHCGLSVPVGVLITIAAGTAIGLLNGVMVAYARMPSIIVTLGMMTVLEGVNQMVLGGNWITDLPPGLRIIGTGSFCNVPFCVLTAIVVVIATMLLARQTSLGRRIYAAGSNPGSASLAGLPVAQLKLFVFALTGFLTAVATVVSVPRLSVIENGVGQGFELLAVTCVVVGGTSVSGGVGTVAGSVLAALLLTLIRPMLIFLKLGINATYWERAIQGAFILVAVLADHIARRSERKGAH